MTIEMDHLMWGAASLEQGMDVAERLFGVVPAPGGAHPGLGTCNALLSLGSAQYLEIIAPDPEQAETEFSRRLTALPEPALITWAAASSDLSQLAAAAAARDLGVRGPRDTERATPSGETLSWQLLFLYDHPYRGLLPFFIDWLASPHPAANNPLAGELERLIICTPMAGELQALFAELGINADVEAAAEDTLSAQILTSSGSITLTSTEAALDARF